jgi:hypothetical protein
MKFFSLLGWFYFIKSEIIPIEPDPGNTGEGREIKGSGFRVGAFFVSSLLFADATG